MRCHYLSDLHLESQDFEGALPKGDVLIIAGDLCHARCLDPLRIDRYSQQQRTRVLHFIDRALVSFEQVLLVAGNHEPYDGVFEDTCDLLRRHLPGVTVLDNETTQIAHIRFFGTTLWTDFGDDAMAMDAVRRRMGEYFFVKTRDGCTAGALRKLRPQDTVAAHRAAWDALLRSIHDADGRSTIVVSHHAPSRLGLNPRFSGNGLDTAYASSLDDAIANFENVPVWIHGHTHVARTYRIGATILRSNALGFAAKGQGAPGFSVKAHFDIG